ncbi:N-acetylglucosamine-6-phosphate deacetylase [Chamaesiphon polymorphus]|uniref:N-acetylglucosamine-6-phosphate deacetylase n=1 Tax=Chamaesiphon polymorphus CCALA 037 TaxID=2107692 RepID=A0A2T1GDT6_9CYAN|nr:N-acetylglucosamine-6-phosphate deacetylase [Chamaesiphon polymorphus]PSB55677.1 N-acetylglucosamine-6-phosphate deacetylase [Chamaesiphon polymorphus CCALA 037]
MKDYKIANARVPGYAGLQEIAISDRQIVNIDRSVHLDLPIVDVAGDWISLGGVDLQINGALGLAFPDVQMGDLDRLDRICDFLWEQGVDGFLPTIVTTSIENIHRSLAVFTKFMAHQRPDTAQLLGVHLEGPFLNRQKRGAHPENYLLPLNSKFVTEVLSKYADTVKAITLAPELDRTDSVIPYLRSLGIIVSLGHSVANFEQAQSAFASGASMVTHAFNAMPGLHHREPGLLGAALTQPHVQCGFIADGQHVHPAMLKVLLRSGRYSEGLFLVSDALSPLGLPDGKYPWDDREIEVINGTARLPDGTLSGTTRSLLVGVQNLVKWDVCDIGDAISLATSAPRQAIGHSTSYIGQTANLLRWNCNVDRELNWQRLSISSSNLPK